MLSIVNAVAGAIPGITSLAGAGSSPASALPGGASSPGPFADLMSDAIGQVSQLQDEANSSVRGLMSGTGVDVHQAMIATQKASMAFELTLAVRNKAVQAYQQVIGMQF